MPHEKPISPDESPGSGGGLFVGVTITRTITGLFDGIDLGSRLFAVHKIADLDVKGRELSNVAHATRAYRRFS
jgi:hypothetical protein